MIQKKAGLAAFLLCISLWIGSAWAQGMPPQGLSPQGLPSWMTAQQQAQQARAKKQYSLAVGHYRRAIRLAPPAMKRNFLREILITYLYQASDYRSSGNFKEALKVFHLAEKMGRQEAKDAYYVALFRREIANTWVALGDYEQAKKAFFWAGLYPSIGEVLMREGKIQEALALYRSIVKCPKENKLYYAKKAAQRIKEGEILRCPKDGTAMYLSELSSIGLCHMRMNQNKTAESAFKAGLKQAKDPVTARTYLALLGALYKKMGRLDEAFQAYRRAGAKLEAAKVLEKMGKKDAAKLWFEESLKENQERIKKLMKAKKNMAKYGGIGRRPMGGPALPARPVGNAFNSMDFTLAQRMKDMGDSFLALESPSNALKAYRDARKYGISYIRKLTDNGRNKYIVRKLEYSLYQKFLKEVEAKIASLER